MSCRANQASEREGIMKAISTQSPWAWLILLGLKPVENRIWRYDYQGPLLIHIGKKFDRDAWCYLCSTPAFKDDVNTLISWAARWENCRVENLPVGIIAGKVHMNGCVMSHPSKYFFGPIGHVYERPEILKSRIPYKGKQRFFEVPDELLREAVR